MKNLTFPIAIEPGSADHAFGVIVPDIPGCYAAGDTLEEAYANAKEAIEAHLDVCSTRACRFPRGARCKSTGAIPTMRISRRGLVATRNIPALKKAVRINISLPEALVQEIDTYAQARGMSRSAFLALAAEHEMAEA